MAVAHKMSQFIEKSSWIRKMFEEGERLRLEFGADKIYDFTLGNPDVEPPEAFQRELRGVIEQMARVQSSQGPVVYVVDDVHWADVASLESIRNLLPIVRERPVLFVFVSTADG